MDVQEQLTRQAAEIGELKGKMDSLATKEFVLEQNAILLEKITSIMKEEINKQTRDIQLKFDDIQDEINKNRQFRTRLTTIGTFSNF